MSSTLTGLRRPRRNSVGVFRPGISRPRVAAARQPWAVRHKPFGLPTRRNSLCSRPAKVGLSLQRGPKTACGGKRPQTAAGSTLEQEQRKIVGSASASLRLQRGLDVKATPAPLPKPAVPTSGRLSAPPARDCRPDGAVVRPGLANGRGTEGGRPRHRPDGPSLHLDRGEPSARRGRNCHPAGQDPSLPICLPFIGVELNRRTAEKGEPFLRHERTECAVQRTAHLHV